jgi:hypothetical protein
MPTRVGIHVFADRTKVDVDGRPPPFAGACFAGNDDVVMTGVSLSQGRLMLPRRIEVARAEGARTDLLLRCCAAEIGECASHRFDG